MSHTVEIDILAFWKVVKVDLNYYLCLNINRKMNLIQTAR